MLSYLYNEREEVKYMSNVLVVYWTATGNTQAMALKVAEGANADLKEISEISAEDALKYEKIAFGCPAMGDTFEEAEEFLEWYLQVEPGLEGKKIAIFGSYGWGSGEWMEDWTDRIGQTTAVLFEEALMANEAPSSDDEELCVAFGQRFAQF